MRPQRHGRTLWAKPLAFVLSALLVWLPLTPLALATEGEAFWASKNQDNLELRVADVGQRLLERNALDQTMSFRVLHRSINEKSNVNAYANSDYGLIWIESGLLRLIRSDDELAGILSHEVAHVLHKDMRWQRLKYYLVEVPMVGFLMIGSLATGGLIVPVALGYFGTKGLRSGMLVFNRGQERDADLEALTLMAKAGYNPDALPVILKRIDGDGSGFTFFRSHPKGSDRLAAMAIALPQARKLYAQNQRPTVAVAKTPKPSPQKPTYDDAEIISSYPIETEDMPIE
jgi:predicted Zn-dependent protease